MVSSCCCFLVLAAYFGELLKIIHAHLSLLCFLTEEGEFASVLGIIHLGTSGC